MANTNAPFGLRWLGLNNSPATPSMSLITRKIASADTQVAYRGDIMLNLTTGYVKAAVTALTATAAIRSSAGAGDSRC